MLTINDVELGVYRWSTESEHYDNNVTMCDFLEFHLPEEFCLNTQDGTYAEIYDSEDGFWEVHASGDGDSFTHKVEFVKIESKI